jgi:hypothetical protein
MVTGKVTIDGQPANSGSVVFATENGQISAPIRPDGMYKAVGVPIGPARIFLKPFPPSPKRQGPPPDTDMGGLKPLQTVEHPVPIPKKYADSQKPQLSFIVQSGSNQYDIELSSK